MISMVMLPSKGVLVVDIVPWRIYSVTSGIYSVGTLADFLDSEDSEVAILIPIV